MAQRRHHYEAAFEEYLRCRRIPYVAVDEARKTLLPADARPMRGPAAAGPLKSFDFVLYGPDENLLAEVKGRKVVGRTSGAGRLESWATREDVESLAAWERLFGEGFRAAFVFVYWWDAQPAAPLFEDVFEHRGRWYALRLIRLDAYAAVMRPRSERWGTVHLPSADFARLSEPFGGVLTGRPG